jgi:hypothetical protein
MVVMSKFICSALLVTAVALIAVRLREAILDYAEDEIDWESQ